MYVNCCNPQSDIALDLANVASIVELVLEAENERCDEISVQFVTLEESGNLHERFFQDPTPTDCMTFPLDEEDDGNYRMIGDLIICPAIALHYAEEHQEDVYEEITLYLIHGLLHLCGYDDIEEQDRLAMREAENRHLEQVKKLDLWLHA